jgi:ribosomal protein L37AE/L43A
MSIKPLDTNQDQLLFCPECAEDTFHRFRPYPEAGDWWRCSECGEGNEDALYDDCKALRQQVNDLKTALDEKSYNERPGGPWNKLEDLATKLASLAVKEKDPITTEAPVKLSFPSISESGVLARAKRGECTVSQWDGIYECRHDNWCVGCMLRDARSRVQKLEKMISSLSPEASSDPMGEGKCTYCHYMPYRSGKHAEDCEWWQIARKYWQTND